MNRKLALRTAKLLFGVALMTAAFLPTQYWLSRGGLNDLWRGYNPILAAVYGVIFLGGAYLAITAFRQR